MNKNAIKTFAIWARNKLIADIEYRAGMLGVSSKGIASPLPQSTHDLQFFDIGTRDYVQVAGREITQRSALISAIRAKEYGSDYASAFRRVVEDVAYTWFNRLIAVRFMEVNDYLPSRIRVLSSENAAKNEPDFVTNPFDTDLVFTTAETDEIMRLKDDGSREASDRLFRMLFIKQCNKLHDILPNLFEKTDDYTELLLTISFTDQDGVVYHLVHDIPEDDFDVSVGGQVEIIGWLYQYYNTEPKDEVFADLKKNIKISKEKIPAATQLFTPDWIVRYMVENSLGRLWTEGHPNDDLKSNWKYYLEEAEQEPQVQAQLADIRKEYAALTPVDIKLIDPCMGSGHILVYAFDVLMQIYMANGYLERDAAQSILQNNLYGLDIDDRAAQLAYFAVMMKARQYDRRIFSREITPHVSALQDSPVKGQEFYALLQNKPAAKRLMQSFHEAKEYGSIIEPDVTLQELDALTAELDALEERLDSVDFVEEAEIRTLLATLRPMIEQGRALKQKYDVVITNPPYMGAGGMGARLSQYVKNNYPDSKSDLFAVFIEHSFKMLKNNGFSSMITMESWMFLSSFEKLRNAVVANKTIYTLVHMPYLGKGGTSLGINFGTDMAVIRKSKQHGYVGTYDRIAYYETDDDGIPFEFPVKNEYYKQITQDNFSKIPGAPVAYWWTNFSIFDLSTLEDYYESAGRNKTHNNELYVRNWWEICDTDRWQPYANGGIFRRWAGNDLDLVDWSAEAKAFYASHGGLYNQKYNGSQGICWNLITSYKNGFRIKHGNHHYSSGAPTIISKRSTNDYAVLAYLNSSVGTALLNMLNPTLNTTVGDVLSLPYSKENETQIGLMAKETTRISQNDWDSFETSWGFQTHPLVAAADEGSLARAFEKWQSDCESRFQQLKANEEELNRIFIDIYGLQDELTPEVEDKDVTVRRADLSRDTRSLISYAVGCMFGRYSLDVPGLAFAGGAWDSSKYSTFIPDRDNCIPITDEEYFEDDIVGRFVNFIRVVYGAETLEENLDFIAKALGNKGDTSRQVIRNYFLNDFMKDHMKIYQKRPIYWQFDSGKQNGFKALVYMHRWNADTVGNLRVEYLHRMQRVYEKEMERMQETIYNSTNTREVAAARKRMEKLAKQLKEAKDYDAKIAHIALNRIEIDLDDGVKVNYEKVQKGADGKSLDVLAKI